MGSEPDRVRVDSSRRRGRAPAGAERDELRAREATARLSILVMRLPARRRTVVGMFKLAPPEARGRAFAAYLAALDAEEAAASEIAGVSSATGH